MNNEITPLGEPCPFLEHSISSPTGNVPREAGSGACVRCLAALAEGQLELDVRAIHRDFRGRYLEFWSLVEIDHPDECWPWVGSTRSDGRAFVNYYRGAEARRLQLPVQRVAAFYSWGDVGKLRISASCKTPNCCNPLHMRIHGVPHFRNQKAMAAVRLYPQAELLNAHARQYLEALAQHRPRRHQRLLPGHRAG
jgi:hypothetical protein